MPSSTRFLTLTVTSSLLILAPRVLAQSSAPAAATTSSSAPSPCESSIEPQFGQPSVAPGWEAKVVAWGLYRPRGMVVDSEGGLLVVQQSREIVRVKWKGEGGCVVEDAGGRREIVGDRTLNHGIDLSADGKTLYASSPSAVYSWDYNAVEEKVTSEPREIISGIGEEDGHITRTLLMSRKEEGMLLVSRGSMSNLDMAALDISTGVSTIKGFNLTALSSDSSYNFAKEGTLLGWGLRNSVGVAEDPNTGAIYSVENSVDNFEREGKNIHENNPGEELNFHGYLNGTRTEQQGGNYGYPSCYAAWAVDEIPENSGIEVGTQFAIGDQNATVNDTFCKDDRVAPRLTFAAHMAPLDIKFNSKGSAAWVTFHGSWNRDKPQGYKLSVLGFANGEPTEPANSNKSAIDIVSNADTAKCPGKCFRPVGLAWDKQGRLFMSSDSTGEIWLISRMDGKAVDGVSPDEGSPTAPSSTSAAPSSSSSPGAAVLGVEVSGFAAVLAAVLAVRLV